jgi:diaminopimelate decarboxylase
MRFLSPFIHRAGTSLHIENVALTAVAERFGTPLYVYSAGHIRQAYQSYANALAGVSADVCYAVKANSNLSVLRLLAALGAGFDIVSAGELARVLEAGADARKVVFSGVGKSAAELEYALNVGVGCFNVESEPELRRLAQIAQRLGKIAPVSLRVNPDVDAKTHPYISTGLKENKFGVAMTEARTVYRQARQLSSIDIIGIDCHIGSQLTDATPYFDALDRVLALADQLATDGLAIRHLDLGGGLGIRYADETPPAIDTVVRQLSAQVRAWAEARGRAMPHLLFEPGRSIVGNAGVLLTRLEHLKPTTEKTFAIVDAAMNDLMRPALYEAFHDMVEVEHLPSRETVTVDVVGPVCETGDWLGKARQLAIAEGDLIAILSAGAYGMSMASNYNSRPRAAEVLIDGSEYRLVRRRESLDDLLRLERVESV